MSDNLSPFEEFKHERLSPVYRTQPASTSNLQPHSWVPHGVVSVHPQFASLFF